MYSSRIVHHAKKLRKGASLLRGRAIYIRSFPNDAGSVVTIHDISRHNGIRPMDKKSMPKFSSTDSFSPNHVSVNKMMMPAVKMSNGHAFWTARSHGLAFSLQFNSQSGRFRQFSTDSGVPPHFEIGMPSLSPTMTEGNIARWLKKEGDKISTGEVLCEVEADKATVEMECMEEGYLAKIVRGDGSSGIKVGEGITSIIGSLQRGESWKTLTQKFGSLKFTNTLVANILFQLKEPIDSRKALKFFHWTAKEMKFDHGISSYCLIIHILVKGGLIKDAKVMFESVMAKDSFDGNSQLFVVLDLLMESYRAVDSVPLVFDLFMQTCAKLRVVDGILDACELLFDKGFVLSVITFNTLLHVLQKSGNVDLVWGVYELMIKRRKCPNEATVKAMISTLCKEGKLERFLSIVDRMHGKRSSVPQLIVNTYLVYEMIEKERIQDGLFLLKHMLQKNMILDTISYSLVVFAKIKLGDLDAAKEIYEEMLKRGFEENSFVCSLFIGAFCDEGRIDEAIGLLEEIERSGFKPSNEAFNHLIKGCSLNGKLEESLEFCKHMMRLGLLPSSSSINVMFEMLCGNGKTKLADEMFTMLLERGFSPDETTYSHLVSGYCRDDDKEGLAKLLCEMEYRSMSPSESLSSSITSLCKSGRLKEGEKYKEIMEAHSLVPSPNVHSCDVLPNPQIPQRKKL